MKKIYLSVKELSELTGISCSTIYKYTASRKIPFVQFGSRRLFIKEEIKEWLKDNNKMYHSDRQLWLVK